MVKDSITHYGTAYRLDPLDGRWKSSDGRVLAPHHVEKELKRREERAVKAKAKRGASGTPQKRAYRRGPILFFPPNFPRTPVCRGRDCFFKPRHVLLRLTICIFSMVV